MKKVIILFTSVTFAIKSRNILSKFNIFSKVIRTPLQFRKGSCGYCLLVNYNREKTLEILRSNGVSVLGSATVDYL